MKQETFDLGEGVSVKVRPEDPHFPVSLDQGSNTIDLDTEGANILLRILHALLASR